MPSSYLIFSPVCMWSCWELEGAVGEVESSERAEVRGPPNTQRVERTVQGQKDFCL